MAAETYTCTHCGAHSNKFWKRLSKGNVGALVKLRRAIGQYNRNDIHIAQDLELTYSERANFSTLRQHGMVAHIKDENGKRVVESEAKEERPKIRLTRDFEAHIVGEDDPKGAGVRIIRTA